LPVSKAELERFRSQVAPALAQLESISGKGYASLPPSDRSQGG
jgi:hypothetical protein